ncbi:bifunctional adenosylcobinamide kinase/adenosylcobinamide-phosphate guanylyltransferase [Shewanella kaireitica]|uniref:bifunctional adenosylcobinamide kinase/adenosylcobinamide-phosphate guanylyltransferase n=1 Tax=Shewanella kaireitica TaxID=212021 RepID=UPI00200DD303|nr:bifunctional adenosylcobinamide kinase/adenosylcobinamide-phosphate guanylyltransferase [Shewanella kaireitica]
MIHLVLGGARSGKSSFAESQVMQRVSDNKNKKGSRQLECLYFATAEALDTEMAARIVQHQSKRQKEAIDWCTIESPLALSAALKRNVQQSSLVLVDCLTLWLTNHLLQATDNWQVTKAEFLQTIAELPGEIILVSNEVGCGVVPMGEISRRFVDEAGWLHQDIAAIADRVTLVTAGLPLRLKG